MSKDKQVRRKFVLTPVAQGERLPPDAVIYETYDVMTTPELSLWEKSKAYVHGGFWASIIALIWFLSPVDDAVEVLLISLLSGGILAMASPFLALLDEVLMIFVGVPIMTIVIGNNLCKRKLKKKNAVIDG